MVVSRIQIKTIAWRWYPGFLIVIAGKFKARFYTRKPVACGLISDIANINLADDTVAGGFR